MMLMRTDPFREIKPRHIEITRAAEPKPINA